MNGEEGKEVKVKRPVFSKHYYSKNSAYDFAILILEEDLAESNGFLGIDTSEENIDEEIEIEIAGYPGEMNKRMYYERGYVKAIDEYFLKYRISTSQGQSGSPVIKKNEFD